MTQDKATMAQTTADIALDGPPQSEGERSESVGGGGPSKAAAAASKNQPDPEVVAKPTRRKFTAVYKMRILDEADECATSGSIGRLLRREGLYSSHLAKWRIARTAGALGGLEPRKRGRKPKAADPLAKTVTRLQRSNDQLQEELRKARLIIEVQKKVAALLELLEEENS